jgi:hypothetical protein
MLLWGCTQPTPRDGGSPTPAPGLTAATTAPSLAATAEATRAPTNTSPPTRTPTAAPPPGGSIRGMITTFSARGYVPSANTNVELRPEIPTDPSDPPRASTRTNSNGQYTLERVENGRYLLTAGSGGLGSPQANVTIANADLVLDLQIDPVAAAFVGRLLTGRVVDSANRPVSGASVWLINGYCHAITAPDGTYSMRVVHDTTGQRILNATTSTRSGFVQVADAASQPAIQLTRPAVSGVPSDVCPTGSTPPFVTPTPAPGSQVTVLRTIVIPRITASLVPKP